MVSDLTDAGPLDDLVDGFEPTDAPEEGVDAAAEPVTEDEQPQPDYAALLARLERAERAASRVDALDQSVRSELGKLRHYQSQVDKLSKQTANGELDARVSTYEDVLASLTDALAGSDLVDDTSRQALRQAKARLETARTQSDRTRLRNELLAELQDATQPVSDPEAPSPWLAATQRVARIAQARGYDPQQIPAEVWRAGQETGDPDLAVDHVAGWVRDQLASPKPDATQRVAARQRAAGTGAPARSAAPLSGQDLIDDYALHPDQYPPGSDAYKRVSQALADL